MLTSVKVINQTKFSKWDLLILKLFNCPILISAMERFPCWSLWWTATKNQKKLEPNVLKKWPQVEGSSKKRRRREGRRGMEALEAKGPWWRWGWRVGIKRVGGPPEVIMVRGQLSSQSRPPQRCVPNSSNDWSSSVPAPHPPTHPPTPSSEGGTTLRLVASRLSSTRHQFTGRIKAASTRTWTRHAPAAQQSCIWLIEISSVDGSLGWLSRCPNQELYFCPGFPFSCVSVYCCACLISCERP